jgi:hypothetical protein
MQKLNDIKLLRVQYVPRTLEPGILYVSEEFGAALHLCACGCGLKVSTPIGPTDWSFEESSAGATMFPSVGNWQQPCQSHYFIWDGRIIWLDTWTPKKSHQVGKGATRGGLLCRARPSTPWSTAQALEVG